MAKVLVTGISGFIARQCAIELLTHGYAVRGTVRSLKRGDELRGSLAAHADIAALDLVEADLMSDSGWDNAMAGCDHVLHLASPFPIAQPKDEKELIRPAVEGTLRVLDAAIRHKIKRFVQTSSTVAIAYGHGHDRTAPFTEADWSDLNGPGITAYARSKTLAERAARDRIAATQPELHFSTINPGLVLGPLSSAEFGSSVEVIQMIMSGKYPGMPRLMFPVVDVRDIALMHRLALETTAPTGGRYMGVADTVWMIDMARALKAELGDGARKVPTRALPDWVVRIVALFDAGARSTLGDLGKPLAVNTSVTRNALGFEFRSARDAIVATGKSLVQLKKV
jgi:dihydroflavonol-4-reductase